MVEKKIEAAAAAQPNTTVSAGAEWLRTVSDAPSSLYASLCRETFGTFSRALLAQTEFVKNLAGCRSPAEVASCQFDFLRSATAASIEEAERAYRSLQSMCTNPSA